MHRFYSDLQFTPGARIVLDEDEAHHAVQVLRLEAGGALTLINGRGAEASATALSVRKREVVAEVTAVRCQEAPAHRIHLCPAVLKGKAMDLVLQKAVELGAHRIEPILTERCVVQIADPQEHAGRWQRAVVEAMKQSGELWMPQVLAPLPFDEAVQNLAGTDLELVASLSPEARHLRVHWDRYVGRRGHPPGSVRVFIGPEGDFSTRELQSLVQRGCGEWSLGPRVLRAETAVLAALAILGNEVSTPTEPSEGPRASSPRPQP